MEYLLTFLFILLPLPSAPYLVSLYASYSNPFYFIPIILCISTSAALTQYYFSKLLFSLPGKFSHLFPGYHLLILKTRKKVNKLSFLEFYLLRQSSTIPFMLINISAGLSHYSPIKFILATFASGILVNILFASISLGLTVAANKLQVTISSLQLALWSFIAINLAIRLFIYCRRRFRNQSK